MHRLLVMEEKSVQTHPLRAIDFHLAGFLGISMLWKGLFSTTADVGRLRQKQVLRRLCLTPLAPITFLAAHVAWSLTVGLLQAALFLLVGYVAFGVRIVGSWPLFIAMVILGSLVSTGLGYCLASLCASAEAGAVAIQIVNFPMMMLSGTLFSIKSLPAYFRPVRGDHAPDVPERCPAATIGRRIPVVSAVGQLRRPGRVGAGLVGGDDQVLAMGVSQRSVLG